MTMPPDDFENALQAERLGDAADVRQAAAGHYREAQRLLMPAGAVWTCREEYDRRMEAFERIQQKIYGLEGKSDYPRLAEAPVPEAAIANTPAPEPVQPPSAAPHLTVWDFAPRLAVRVCQSFTDFDGQEIREGEMLHFLGRTYFPYDGGHTLTFAEKTIRLAGIVDEHDLIVENANNAWFEPIP
jgi:hypothetical protein